MDPNTDLNLNFPVNVYGKCQENIGFLEEDAEDNDEALYETEVASIGALRFSCVFPLHDSFYIVGGVPHMQSKQALLNQSLNMLEWKIFNKSGNDSESVISVDDINIILSQSTDLLRHKSAVFGRAFSASSN